jgi:hypothetical protein
MMGLRLLSRVSPPAEAARVEVTEKEPSPVAQAALKAARQTGGSQMGHHRVKEERRQRIQLGCRYVGLDVGQFYWECLKLAAAPEELTETDILRRVIRSRSETLPPTIQEMARAETNRLEAWKAQELRAREDAKFQAKQGKSNTSSSQLTEKRISRA